MEFDEKTIALLSGLVGSILTVLITKIIDLIQKHKEHNFQFKKAYFDKKLASAENAISLWYATSVNLGNMAAIYDRVAIDESELGTEWFENLYKLYGNKLTELDKLSNQLQNSIYLYFDLENNGKYNYDPLKELYERVSRINMLSETIQSAENEFDKAKGTQYEELAKKELENYYQQLRLCFQDLSTIMKHAQNELTDFIKQLRIEMKEYEK